MSVPGPTRHRSQPAGDERRERGRQAGVEKVLATLGVLVIAGLVLGGIVGLALRAVLPSSPESVVPVAAPSQTPSPTPSGAADDEASPGAAPAGPVQPATVSVYDPLGDGAGNPGVEAIIDGDPATVWRTERYTTADFGGLKDGMGLLLDLGSPQPVSSLSVQFARPGAGVQLRTAESPDADPAQLSVVATSENVGTSVTLTPQETVTSRYVVVWLTSLPDAARGGFRAGIADVAVNG